MGYKNNKRLNPFVSFNMGQTLMKLRMQKGLNRMEFARKTGLPKPTTLYVETKGKDITLTTLYSYAYGLDMDLIKLIKVLEYEGDK